MVFFSVDRLSQPVVIVVVIIVMLYFRCRFLQVGTGRGGESVYLGSHSAHRSPSAPESHPTLPCDRKTRQPWRISLRIVYVHADWSVDRSRR